MDDHSIWMIAVIACLVVLSAYFSATETAFTSVNRIKIKNMAADGDERAERVLALTDQYDKVLSTILVGNNIVNITMTAMATVLFVSAYGSRGATISTIVMTLVVLIFGEISPKSLAKEGAEGFSKFSAPILRFFMVLLTPITFVFSGWKKLLNKIFKVGGAHNFSEDELLTMVEEAETEGSLEQEQSELIQNAIEFNDLEAEEVMTPRVDIEAIDLDTTEDDIADVFKTTGFSRLPVYEGDMDSVQGVLNQKDFYNYVYGNGHTVSDFVKPVVFVAGSMKIASLLRKLQAMKTHMAIVVDEYGGTEGLVTMEDIIEELVGEIYDEHDAIMSQEVTELQNGSYRVMAGASISKIFDYFDVHEEIDANTVNGWVALCLDKLPEKGDTFETVIDKKVFAGRVTKATDKKALEINLRVTDAPDQEEAEATGV